MTWGETAKAAVLCIGIIFLLEAAKAAFGFWPAFGIALAVLAAVAWLEGDA
jgi:hypothetical protein